MLARKRDPGLVMDGIAACFLKDRTITQTPMAEASFASGTMPHIPPILVHDIIIQNDAPNAD